MARQWWVAGYSSKCMIIENIGEIRQSISNICRSCGRDPSEIRLIAVSKTWGSDAIRQAVEGGILDFGENYVQEMGRKREDLEDIPIKWHFIGHLQSNKVKYLAAYVDLIHSVDSFKLAEEISKRGLLAGRKLRILIEVHTTDEKTKHGVPPDKTLELVKEISLLENVDIQGLMTMGPFSDDPEDSRSSFRQLVHVKKRIEAEGIGNVSMRHLSMGMTYDYPVAIEEGATMVRIGTAIFGTRKNK